MRKISWLRGVLVIVAMLASSLAVQLFLYHRHGLENLDFRWWVAVSFAPITIGGAVGLGLVWAVLVWSKRKGYS